MLQLYQSYLKALPYPTYMKSKMTEDSASISLATIAANHSLTN